MMGYIVLVLHSLKVNMVRLDQALQGLVQSGVTSQSLTCKGHADNHLLHVLSTYLPILGLVLDDIFTSQLV